MADIQIGFPGYYDGRWYTVSDKTATDYLLTFPNEVDQWVPKTEVSLLYRQRSLVWFDGQGDQSGLPFAFYKFVIKEIPWRPEPMAEIYSSTPPRTYFVRELRRLTTFKI